MSDIQRDIEQIRKAIYGKDVRESIAHGIETCYAEMRQSVNIGAIITGASGEEITLTDSAEAPLQSLKLYGKSTQTQTSGKQLFNATLQNGSQSGITYKRNADGTYTLTGTSTDTVGLMFGTYNFVSGVQYRLVGFQGTGIKGQFALYVNGQEYPNDIGNGVTFTATSTTNSKINITIPTGTTVNMLVKPMLTTDLSATYDDYEPYTGGIPAPNPDYPQPIYDVDNAEITVRGRNLCFGNYNQSIVGMNINLDNSKLSMKGKATAGTYVTIPINNIENGTYTINLTSNGNLPSGFYLYLRDQESTFITSITSLNRPVTITNNIGYLRVGWGNDADANVDINIQIEKGSVAHDFEPYKAPQTANIPYTLRGIGNVKDELLLNADGTGKLITRFNEVDLGTLNYSYDSSSRRFYSTQLKGLVKAPANTSTALKGICESYSVTYWNKLNESGTDNFIVYLGGASEQIGIRDTRYTTPADFKSAMNGVSLIYELATPTETNLTSEEVAQILTLNTFYPTSIISNDKQAEMEVKYIADTKAYVDAHSGGGSAEQIYPNNPNEPIKVGKFGNKDVMRKYILFALPDIGTTEIPFNVTLAEGIDLIVNKTIFFNNSGLPNASEVAGKRGSYLELSSYTSQVDYVEYSNYIFLDGDKLIARFGGRQGTLEVKGFIDYVPVL